jgi:hypothetical protein
MMCKSLGESIQLKIDVCSGAIAGLLTDFILHPMDTITTRLWIQGSPGTKYKYNGLIQGLSQVFNLEGLKGLYKGFFAVALLSPAGYGLYFATYNWCKVRLLLNVQNGPKYLDSVMHAASGIAANALGGLAWTPMDVVKLHQQASVKAGFSSPIHGLWHLCRSEGSLIVPCFVCYALFI